MASRLKAFINRQRLRMVVSWHRFTTNLRNTRFTSLVRSRRFLIATYMVVMVALAGVWWWNSPYRLWGQSPQVNLPDAPPLTQTPTTGTSTPPPAEQKPTEQPTKPVVEPPKPTENPAATEKPAVPDKPVTGQTAEAQPVMLQITAIDKLRKPVEGAIVKDHGFKWSATYQDFRYHDGIGIAAAQGTPVVAAYAGRVKSITTDHAEWGTIVVIEHGSGWRTEYANVAKVSVKAGQTVAEGQQIGQVGPNPPARSAEAPHLYFALFEHDESVDPVKMFR